LITTSRDRWIFPTESWEMRNSITVINTISVIRVLLIRIFKFFINLSSWSKIKLWKGNVFCLNFYVGWLLWMTFIIFLSYYNLFYLYNIVTLCWSGILWLRDCVHWDSRKYIHDLTHCVVVGLWHKSNSCLYLISRNN
jgi:hypothetical protein